MAQAAPKPKCPVDMSDVRVEKTGNPGVEVHHMVGKENKAKAAKPAPAPAKDSTE